MKVKYFEGFVLDTLGRAGIQAQSFAAAGYSDKPYGVQVDHGGVTLLVQFVRASSASEDKDAPEEYTPTPGLPPISVPEASGKPVAVFEQTFKGILEQSGYSGVASVRTLSREGSRKAGLEVSCPDGVKLYALVVRASGSGGGRHPDYEMPDTLL